MLKAIDNAWKTVADILQSSENPFGESHMERWVWNAGSFGPSFAQALLTSPDVQKQLPKNVLNTIVPWTQGPYFFHGDVPGLTSIITLENAGDMLDITADVLEDQWYGCSDLHFHTVVFVVSRISTFHIVPSWYTIHVFSAQFEVVYHTHFPHRDSYRGYTRVLHHVKSQLVGGLEHFLFSHILGIIIPID